MSRSLATKTIRGCQCLRFTSPFGLCSNSFIPAANRDVSKRAYSNLHAQQSLSRGRISSSLTACCIISSLLGTLAYQSLRRPLSNDAPPGSELISPNTEGAQIGIAKENDHDVDQVDTGTTTVPFFPRTIWLPRPGTVSDGRSRALPAGLGVVDSEEEYQLLGLGIRTVSLFSIEVYVMGMYVARSDLGKLQEGMVRATAAPGATTLVEGEKEQLKRTLLDSEGSEKIWDTILKQEGIKSAARIVPTKGAGFGHLRDGWLKGITARGKAENCSREPDFQEAVRDFKGIFGGGGAAGVSKGKALLLGRGGDGRLTVWMERGKDEGGVAGRAGTMAALGSVQDERIGRFIWLGYLAGKTVACEGARKNVAEGVMDLVERPIGTVETQVV
ncbi:hypothetical protein MMC07_004731 [Pseudocyphellaria aurata]|nr:hypothetical protein [Pseudocyphellaria aurata]